MDGLTLPGGHVEKGESIVDAVIREMKERNRFNHSKPSVMRSKTIPHRKRAVYRIPVPRKSIYREVVSSDEGEMYWVSKEALSDVHLAEDFHELVQVMLDDRLTEFQYVVDNGQWKAVIK